MHVLTKTTQTPYHESLRRERRNSGFSGEMNNYLNCNKILQSFLKPCENAKSTETRFYVPRGRCRLTGGLFAASCGWVFWYQLHPEPTTHFVLKGGERERERKRKLKLRLVLCKAFKTNRLHNHDAKLHLFDHQNEQTRFQYTVLGSLRYLRNNKGLSPIWKAVNCWHVYGHFQPSPSKSKMIKNVGFRSKHKNPLVLSVFYFRVFSPPIATACWTPD